METDLALPLTETGQWASVAALLPVPGLALPQALLFAAGGSKSVPAEVITTLLTMGLSPTAKARREHTHTHTHTLTHWERDGVGALNRERE